MQSLFGQNGERTQALITRLADLSAEEMNEIADAWKQGSTLDRALAWAHLSRISTEQERSQILAAASLARREAMTAAHRLRSADWTIWAAAGDAAAALAAGIRLGRHYTALTAPLAAVMPSLLVYNPRPPLELLPVHGAAPGGSTSDMAPRPRTAATMMVAQGGRRRVRGKDWVHLRVPKS